MATRIFKTEKFLPKTGNPVFQIYEETETGTQVFQHDPRNPTPEELQDADDSFAAEQQKVIATFLSEKSALANLFAEKTKQADKLTEEKKEVNSQLAIATEAVSQLTTEKATLTQSLTAAQSQLAALQSQLDTITTAKATVDASLATRTAELATAQARITFLTNELPFDPRVVSVTAFRNRLAEVLDPGDLITLYASEANPTLKAIAATITNWPATDPIRLDSPELVQPLGILVQYDLLYPEEVDALRRDATREEAYFAPE